MSSKKFPLIPTASELSAVLTVICLLVVAVGFFLQKIELINQATIVMYIFLVITIIQIIYESINNVHSKSNISTIKTFWRLLYSSFKKKVAIVYKWTKKYFYQIGYVLLALVSWQLIINIKSYIDFYYDFMIVDQLTSFWHNTGIYLLGLYLFALAIFLGFQFRVTFFQKIISGLLILSLLIWLSQIIFDRTTTDYHIKPYIWSMTPKTVTLWDEVKITGRNFQNLPWQGKVIVAGEEHRILKWSDREIIFQVEPGKTKSGRVVVLTKDDRQSNSVELVIEAYDFFTREKIQ